MKNIIYKINILLLAVVLFSSCSSDILDPAPNGRTTIEELLKDPETVEMLFNTCYGYTDPTTGVQYIIHGKGFHYWWWVCRAGVTDEAWEPDLSNSGTMPNLYYKDANTAASHSLDGGSLANTQWVRYWILIKQCTDFIGYMDNPEAQVTTNPYNGKNLTVEEKKKAMKADILVLRSFFYMELLKLYGQLPVYDVAPGQDADFSVLKRESAYTIAQRIVADCDAAIAEPNFIWRASTAAEAGRMTKAVACALKSEAMLYAASPLFNEGANYWEEAYQQSKEAVEKLKANGYALYTTCTEPDIFAASYMNPLAKKAAAYREYFSKKGDYASSPRDKETIFQVAGDPYDWAGQIWHIGYIGSNMPTTYKAGACPTQEMVDAYETSDGQTILNLKNPYNDAETHLSPNYNTANKTYDKQNPYANRDPRFYQCVVYNGDSIRWQGEGAQENEIVTWGIETYAGGRHSITATLTDFKSTPTGYFSSKFIYPEACALNQVVTAAWKYYRLGETLLNLAEAAAEAGHQAEALAALNEVRARVGMPAVPSSVSGEDLILRVRNERRVELNWEEVRYFDIRRWQKPTGDLSQTCRYFTCMWITKNADGTFTYERRQIDPSYRIGGWRNRDLLLPIPQDEANLLTNYTNSNWQNPGW
jgi:hypothetical protein